MDERIDMISKSYIVHDWIDLASEYRTKNRPHHPLLLRESFLMRNTVKNVKDCYLDGHRFILVSVWRSARFETGKETIGVEEKFHAWALPKLKSHHTEVFGAPKQEGLL